MSCEAQSFFDKYPHEYDLLTNAAKREQYHRREVEALTETFRPANVLDAGCGTGLTSRLFAQQGVAVVGLDRARKMIGLARDKYAEEGASLSFRYGHFERLPKAIHGRFDLVVCLANAISGLGTQGKLRLAMKNFRFALKPGGALVLQMLNYESMADGELFPVKATRNDNIVYIRYAQRRGRQHLLHVVRLDLTTDPVSFEPFCHETDNFTPQQVVEAAQGVGFVSIRPYRDLYLQKRFIKKSRDFVLVGVRP